MELITSCLPRFTGTSTRWSNSAVFERIIIGVIIVNAITLGLETSDLAMAAVGAALIAVDRAILTIFVVELLIRFSVRRLAFFRDPWRIFDLIVVGVALVPATGNLSVLRASGSCGCCGWSARFPPCAAWSAVFSTRSRAWARSCSCWRSSSTSSR